MNLISVLENWSEIRAAWDAGESLVADGRLAVKDFLAFKDAVLNLLGKNSGPHTPIPGEDVTTAPSANDLNRQELDLLKQYAPWYAPSGAVTWSS